MSDPAKEFGADSANGVRMPGAFAGFGMRLRAMRKALRVNQTEAAQAAGGWRTDTWSRIERGDSVGIPLALLLGLAAWVQEHGFSLQWLLLGQGEMREQPSPAANEIVLRISLEPKPSSAPSAPSPPGVASAKPGAAEAASGKDPA